MCAVEAPLAHILHGCNTGRENLRHHRTLADFQETPAFHHGQRPSVRPHLCSRLPQTPCQGPNHFNNISTSLQQSFKQIFVPVTCHKALFSSDSQDPLDVCIFPIPPNTKTNPVNLVNQATRPHALQTTPTTFNHPADKVSTLGSTQCALCSQAEGMMTH